MRRLNITICLLIAVLCGQWSVELVARTTSVYHPFPSRLYFGVDSAATDGFDPYIDEPAPPPAPDGFRICFYLYDPEIPYIDGLYRDFRSLLEDSIRWEIIFAMSPTDSGWIEWDVLTLPEFGDFRLAVMEDTTERAEIDMRTESISPKISTNQRFFIIYRRSGNILDVSNLKGIKISIYPNPFNQSCFIKAPENAEIMIFDIFGRRVAYLPAGKSIWRPEENVASGAYFVKTICKQGTIGRRIFYKK